MKHWGYIGVDEKESFHSRGAMVNRLMRSLQGKPKQKGLFDAIMLNYEMSSLNGLAVIRKCQDKF